MNQSKIWVPSQHRARFLHFLTASQILKQTLWTMVNNSTILHDLLSKFLLEGYLALRMCYFKKIRKILFLLFCRSKNQKFLQWLKSTNICNKVCFAFGAAKQYNFFNFWMCGYIPCDLIHTVLSSLSKQAPPHFFAYIDKMVISKYLISDWLTEQT